MLHSFREAILEQPALEFRQPTSSNIFDITLDQQQLHQLALQARIVLAITLRRSFDTFHIRLDQPTRMLELALALLRLAIHNSTFTIPMRTS